MKPSGIEWIGEIPEGWEISKFKYEVATPIIDGPHETPDLYNEGIPFVSAESIKNGKIDLDLKRGFISEKDHLVFSRKVHPKINDIFIVKSGAGTGQSGIVDFDEIFDIWSPLALIRVKTDIHSQKFIFYFIQSRAYSSQVENSWSFGTQQNIGMNVLEKLYLVLPSLYEQKAIAAFLDAQCAKIDAIVSEMEQQIEVLKQYKISLITETVTKGLNKAAPMKDSGIEWIGKIPAHWEVKRLKYCLKTPLQYGANEVGCEFDEKEPRYIRITDITLDNRLKEDDKLSLPIKIAKPYLLSDGDILFARSGATVGKTFYFYSKYGQAAFAGYLIRASIDKNKLLPEYLYYLTLGNGYQNWLNLVYSQATIQNIGANKYENFPVIYPLINEQREIVKIITDKIEKMDKLIKEKQQSIETMKAYKKSLIYEYVTGKKRVTAYMPQILDKKGKR